MRVLNFGSLNIDYVFRVEHTVRPGQTAVSPTLDIYAGGKGANQSMALARGGGRVCHAGRIGEDGRWLGNKLGRAGVECRYLTVDEGRTGLAMIQVDQMGQSAIVYFPGANARIDRSQIDAVLANFSEGDALLLQNEINDVAYLMQAGHDRGMKVIFNPAPYTLEVNHYPLHLLDTLILNEHEAMELSAAMFTDEMMDRLAERLPETRLVLRMGEAGAVYRFHHETVQVPAYSVKAVDMTAASDAFIGFYIAAISRGQPVEQALRIGCAAAALSVTRSGAMDSIPTLQEAAALAEEG